MLPVMTTSSAPRPAVSGSSGPLVVAVLSGAAHLAVGVLYAAGGLSIPGAVLFPLWAVWGGLAVWLVRLALRRSWWTPAVPVLAVTVFFAVLTVGEQLLGWRG